jgi:peptide/nickel transport system permease protein
MSEVATIAAVKAPGRARPSVLRTVWAFARRRPLGAVGAAIVLTLALAALLAPVIAPYDPLETDFLAQLQPPSRAHWLGADQFGRDVLSRLLYGARTALLVGFSSAFIGATLGALLGTCSAYFGGRVDLVLQRILEIFLSFPIIVLALAVVAVLGTGTVNVILAITVPIIPQVARVVRSRCGRCRSSSRRERWGPGPPASSCCTCCPT